jgi:cytochrome c-type biogenesis protein CcmH
MRKRKNTMIELWLGLLLLILLAMGLLYALAKRHQMLKSPVILISFISLPLMVLLGYWQLGQPVLVAEQHQQRTVENATRTLVDQLEARLIQTPEDIQGWMMLGHSHSTLENWRRASEAYERAYQLDQNNPLVMIALADSLAEREGGVYNLRAQALVATARKLASSSVDVLWASALVSRQNGDLEQTVKDLSALQGLLQQDSSEWQVVSKLLEALNKINLNTEVK